MNKIDIGQYIPMYEKREISLEQIAKKEDIKIHKIKKKIKTYYNKKGKKAPKIGMSMDILMYFLIRGMTKEEIRKNAAKRNIIIPDEYFEKAKDKISKDEEER